MLQVMSEFPFFDPLFCDILIFSLQMMTATINKPTPFATKSSYSFFLLEGHFKLQILLLHDYISPL
jgi:hypothetical protein